MYKNSSSNKTNISVISNLMFIILSFLICSIVINRIDEVYTFNQLLTKDVWYGIICPKNNLTTAMVWIFTIGAGFIEAYIIASVNDWTVMFISTIVTIAINLVCTIIIYFVITFLFNVVAFFSANWWFLAFCIFLLSGAGGELIATIASAGGEVIAEIFRL